MSSPVRVVSPIDARIADTRRRPGCFSPGVVRWDSRGQLTDRLVCMAADPEPRASRQRHEMMRA